MNRIDPGVVNDAEEAVSESMQELMSISSFQLPLLLHRFDEYLPAVKIPIQLSNMIA